MKTKLNYHKDKDAFEKWASDYCEQRHIATLKYLFEKAGENPLKKRFYLGKNIKEKAESISSNYGNFLSNRIPDKNGNIKFRTIITYGATPYYKVCWRTFKKWQKQVERNGFVLKRDWMEKPYRFRLHKERRLESPYRKFCSYWWKSVLENLFSFWKYNQKVCTYDYYDIFENLIVNLTIKGVYQSLFGNAIVHKEQAHTIWKAREKLIKAYLIENYCEGKAKKDVKEKYGIDFDRKTFDLDTYIENGSIEERKDNKFNFMLNPLIVEEKLFGTHLVEGKEKRNERKLVLQKISEIEEFFCKKEIEHRKSDIHMDGEKYAVEAFEYVAKNIYDWWD